MKAKLAKFCSVLALLAGVTMLGGAEFDCGFEDDDDLFDKAAVTQSQ